MIGKGHPKKKETPKNYANVGSDLFLATDSNLLFLREGERWICLGHVAHDVHTPTLNQRQPRLEAFRTNLPLAWIPCELANASASTSARVLREIISEAQG